MNTQMSAYDHRGMVIVSLAIFLILAFSFYHPRTKRLEVVRCLICIPYHLFGEIEIPTRV